MAKKFPTPKPDEPEGWLTSYADLMSLLTCFFMLMMAFANYDPPGFQQKAKIIAESFNKTSGQSQLEMEKLKSEITHHPDFEDRLKLTVNDGKLIIVFTGSAVFPEGKYQLDKQTNSMVDTLIDLIKSHQVDYRIFIEGHADKNENLVGENMNHWALSAARSASVAARFEYYGFKSEYMAAIAKGDREPISEYKAQLKKGVPPQEISKLNRRVVIKVLEPYGVKNSRMGLGTLYEDSSAPYRNDDVSLFQNADN